MATLELKKCPICFDLFTQPRKLPVCKHVFCENCIFTHLSNLTLKLENETEFPCPVCRVVSPFPENKDDIRSWIQENFELADVPVKRKSPSESAAMCQPCERLNMSSNAGLYCVQCRDYLCRICCDIGHAFRMMADHDILEVNKNEPLSEKDFDIIPVIADMVTCSRHPDRTYTKLCIDHEELCCAICWEVSHADCHDVVEIKEQVCTKPIKERLCSVKEVTAKLISYCEKMIAAKRANETENKKDSEKIVSNIREMRTKLNNLFDVMEETVERNCRSLIKKNVLALLDGIERLENVVSNLSVLKHVIEKIMQVGSPSLIHIVSRALQKRVYEHENSMLEIRNDSKKYGFELNLSDEWRTILSIGPNEIQRLVDISETEMEADFGNYAIIEQLKHCQIDSVSVHIILPESHIAKGKDGSYPVYCSVLWTPDGLFFCDENYGYCIKSNTSYRFLCSFKLTTETKVGKPGKPFCATLVRSGEIAISIPAEKEIYLLTGSETLTVERCISVNYTPKALVGLPNGDLAISWDSPVAFGIVSPKNWFQNKVYFDRDNSGRIFKSFDYMAVDKKRSNVIQPCRKDKAVYCFAFSGKPVFAYTSEDLENPKGVDIDRDGNIYVCDSSKSCIHIIAPDGKAIRLFKEGCPNMPLAIAFSGSGNQFFISRSSKDHFSTEKRKIQEFKLIYSSVSEAK